MSRRSPAAAAALLLASIPAAAALQPCKQCRRPAWSWETVGHMAFTHTCNVSGPWSEEALDVLEKFPMVNIERFMGQHEQCFAKHREQWAAPGCWLNSTHGNPACSTAVGGTHHAGCNCTCEEAPVGATPDGRDLCVPPPPPPPPPPAQAPTHHPTG
eukprot:COSAG04_NODE_869_length_9750_cov_4.497047_1_plen_157_part_00